MRPSPQKEIARSQVYKGSKRVRLSRRCCSLVTPRGQYEIFVIAKKERSIRAWRDRKRRQRDCWSPWNDSWWTPRRTPILLTVLWIRCGSHNPRKEETIEEHRVQCLGELHAPCRYGTVLPSVYFIVISCNHYSLHLYGHLISVKLFQLFLVLQLLLLLLLLLLLYKKL